MFKSIIMSISYTMLTLLIRLPIVDTERPALVGIVLVINVPVLNRRPIPPTLQKKSKMPLTTIALIVVLFLL